MEMIDKEQFNLDEEITKLNEPIRYSSTKLKYFYTEQDIRILFNKAESIYLKQIEEKDKEKYEAMKYQAEVLLKIENKLNKQLQEAKELLKEVISYTTRSFDEDLEEKIEEFLNKQD